MTNNKLPTIADIYSGNTSERALSELQKNEQFLALMNQQPPVEWIKRNKFAGNAAYLPIDKVEFLLKLFFKEHRVEILKSEIAFNAVVVSVRVHYKHPIRNEWTFQDGIGGAEVQTKAGCSASDLASITKNAVAMAFPIAKSEAIKDACHLIGDVFGGNLNRKDTIEYVGDSGLLPEPEPIKLPDYPIERAKESMPKWIDKNTQPDKIINRIKSELDLSETVAAYITFCLTTASLNQTEKEQALSQLPSELQDNPHFIEFVWGKGNA